MPWTKVRNDIAAIVPVPKDKRSIFVVPWGDLTYIGTTDTDYDGPIDDPQCTPDDVEYLLRAMNAASGEPLTPADVVGTWAGLRPLLAGGNVSEKTADLSRRHGVRISPAGLVTVTGGKLTTYRRMAADTIDAVSRLLGRRSRCRTKQLTLLGGEGFEAPADDERAQPPRAPRRALRHRGDHVLDLARRRPRARRAARPRAAVPARRGHLRGAPRDGRTVDDVLSRRTGPACSARDASRARPRSPSPRLIAPGARVGRGRDRSEVDAYRAALAHERTSAQLPETALDASLGA